MTTVESHHKDCARVYFKRDSCRIEGDRGSHSYPLYEALLSKGDQNSAEQIKTLSENITSSGKPQNIPSG